MHLKSLTLRGFKSFASSTTLRFEPGITCVVGPNGSGKSNVVDAIAWVLGEQGAKALRGGKMEDVIFAGTAGRPPLGRAEVVLTIDNSDGALPIDYTEVTVSRIMFRGGGSEYAINGNPCRLLDVQELLSDSGIGRELHVVVGQGQLDQVLAASPEERRGFIEEAAGVLKHRKRKEKALRKLEAMQANLNRLTDLTAELRRQLKPLGRQAEVARKAAQVQADARDARLRLLADDLVRLREELAAEVADEAAVRSRRDTVEAELAQAQAREAELEAVVAADAPRLAAAQETWYRLSSLRERFRGTASLAAERVRYAADDVDEPRTGRDPDELDREAAAVRAEQEQLAATLERDRAALAEAVAARTEAERRLAAEEKAVVAAARAAADRREGLARLTGQVAALRSRAAAADAEIGRLSAALDEAVARAERAGADFAALESEVAGLDEGEMGLDAAYERAAAALTDAESRLGGLQAQEREAERERTSHAARRDALALSLARKDGAGALLAAAGRTGGVLGPVSAVVTVRPGAEAALAAALGAAADAVAVGSIDAAADALDLLKADDAGRAGLIVAGAPVLDDPRSWPALPAGATYAVELVTAPDGVRSSLTRLLARVAVVDDLAGARRLVAALGAEGVRAVTTAGDLLGADWSVGGSASAPSTLEVQAAHDEAERRLAEATARSERLRADIAAAQAERARAAAAVEAAMARLNESDARLAAVAEQLGQLATAARAAAEEAERLRAARARAEEARDRDLTGLAGLEERLAAAQEAPDHGDISTEERDRLAEACTSARSVELEARLAVRTGEERLAALTGRADALHRAAAQERAARERLAAARARRARAATVARAVLVAARAALDGIEGSLAVAAEQRREAETARTVREGELLALRARTRELATELEQLTSAVYRDEVQRAEQRMRIEQLAAKALDDYGIAVEDLVAEYGPDRPVPPVPGPDGAVAEDAEPVPYDRAEQEKRLAAAERALALLGRVNPLALEEFAALEERHQFLQTQLEDLKATRRDLLTVVREVDERIHEVFTSAFHDTAAEFQKVFGILFPGGSGSLVLTDPDDLLSSGIEIEARPPGKKVKRLSLLSGGERSLTAVAFLCAIFRARPSPFYVLDEVEAALDDRNLGRLLDLLAELRSTSQLIVITHQKRTMEIADALYGVTMRGDGVTTVISQRLREREPA